MKKIIILISHLIARFNSFEGTIFVSCFAYSLLLGFTPVLLVLVLIFTRLLLPIEQLTQFLTQFIPPDFIQPFIEFILNNNSQDFLALLVFTIIGFWIASRSLYSFLLISASQDEVDYPSWFVRMLSLFIFVFLFALCFLLVLCSQLFYSKIIYFQPFILFIGFCLFYRFLAFRAYCFSDVYKGAIFATLGISLLGGLFFFVIDNFTTYQSVYGPMYSLVILLLSLYIISSIIYLGFCINHLLLKPYQISNAIHYTFIFNWIKKRIPFKWLK